MLSNSTCISLLDATDFHSFNPGSIFGWGAWGSEALHVALFGQLHHPCNQQCGRVCKTSHRWEWKIIEVTRIQRTIIGCANEYLMFCKDFRKGEHWGLEGIATSSFLRKKNLNWYADHKWIFYKWYIFSVINWIRLKFSVSEVN